MSSARSDISFITLATLPTDCLGIKPTHKKRFNITGYTYDMQLLYT